MGRTATARSSATRKVMADVLEGAARFLMLKGWTRRAMARDADRHITEYRSETAVMFCAIGAVRRTVHDLGHTQFEVGDPVRNVLDREVLREYGVDGIMTWNDEHARDRRSVASLLRRVARRLRK